MVHIFIGLGSNLGHRRRNILSAWKELTNRVNAQSKKFSFQLSAPRFPKNAEEISSPYLSEPLGIDSENWFINAVGTMATEMSPDQLLTEMLAIETDMGRDRSRGDDRLIDLDLLYYDDLILEQQNLTLPHPGIADRLFVLLPLKELAPEYSHPVLALTNSEMLAQLKSRKIVKKASWNLEKV
ncbi:MAG: 2-amino-4-hydroxy-6-hydroxymethyldihydropteridine diphosphokinase [Desulfobia sp.]